jgi:hypothetical protein
MSIFLEQAIQILNSVEDSDPKMKEAKTKLTELSDINKSAAISDLINNPTFQNVVNLLTPFVVNYKVNQVLKLLNELSKEQSPDKYKKYL